jgi:hypothetical protein
MRKLNGWETREAVPLFLPMACRALTASLHPCRNWSSQGGDFCVAHRSYTPELHKDRWFKRHILGEGDGATPFHYSFSTADEREAICQPIQTGEIRLTKDNVRKIPAAESYIDVYVLLVSLGVVEPLDHPSLFNKCGTYYFRTLHQDISPIPKTCLEIEATLLAPSGRMLCQYLKAIPKVVLLRRANPTYYLLFTRIVPRLLDSEAAKELSWESRDRLDRIRLLYEEELGAEHPLTRTLVQRWLPDLKELYVTEKAIQKMKMDQCKEELMMNRWHPDRVWKYLEMGLEIDDM